MTVLNVIIAVILLVIALLLFVLLSPLSVRIVYEDGVVVKIGLSFVKIKVFPKKEKKEKTKKDKRKQKKAKSQKNAPEGSHAFDNNESSDTDESDKKKSSVKDTVTLVYDIVKSVFEMLGKRATIRIDTLRVVVSKEEAADTAVQFGLCSGIVTSILAFTSNFGKSVIKDENVSVEPDFVSGKSKIELDITLSARVINVAASLLRGYFKNQSRK